MYQTIITLLLTAGMTSHSQAITFDEAIKHGTNTGLIRFGIFLSILMLQETQNLS